MVSRYDIRDIGLNRTGIYKNIIKDRGLKNLRQYFSPDLKHPTEEEVAELQLVGHTWAVGDKYFKLADRFYGDVTLWWVIAWFNHAPTESHLSPGDVINIPLPLDRILKFLGL